MTSCLFGLGACAGDDSGGADGVAYSRAKRTFFIWRNDCNDAVLPDAITSAGFPD